ncbi:MAG: phosphoribosylaminoimidazolesuccinocarboxamide synthase [Promethearchaeati archaeon SRVP18_Atabeyarchaeia-1]
MGSVKDLEVLNAPTRDKTGIGRFHFSDRYSVFDWGEMPDLIQDKGAALCLMGAYCFEQLEKETKTKTHYRGLVATDGECGVRTKDLDGPTDVMEVDLVNVIRPQPYTTDYGGLRYDYSVFTPELGNFLIPLEIIYRNGLPEGSSVFKRLEQGLIEPRDLGLDHYPTPGEQLEKPVFDLSTKLEKGDRYITWLEAKEIASLADEEADQIKEILLKVDRLITKISSKIKLKNEDGKIELAFDPSREPMVVDVIGTLDECRFTYQGMHVSKEVARQFYRKTDWYKGVEDAKKEAKEKGVEDWKTLCKSTPQRLDPALKKIIEDMYASTANEFVGSRIFDSPKLSEVMKEYKSHAQNLEKSP